MRIHARMPALGVSCSKMGYASTLNCTESSCRCATWGRECNRCIIHVPKPFTTILLTDDTDDGVSLPIAVLNSVDHQSALAKLWQC
jgi:hypothetical protein